MAKLVMDRKASDNKYLHRDFHRSMDIGIAYIADKYGEKGVTEYLTTFANAYYKPLIEKIQTEGLKPLEEHIRNIYEIEEASEDLSIANEGKELTVSVAKCPAVTYMKSVGHTPSKWYVEATRTVNQALADATGLGFEMQEYCEDNGKAKYRFFVK